MKRQTFKSKDALVSLCGASTAAEESEFIYVEGGIRLDCGIGMPRYTPNIFITHTHYDHWKKLLSVVLNNPPKRKTRVYVPPRTKKFFCRALDSMLQLNTLKANASCRGQCEIVEVQASVPFIVTSNNKKLVVIPFDTDHMDIVIQTPLKKQTKRKKYPNTKYSASIGYAFVELRKRRKEEYKELTEGEIKQMKMKDRSIEISEEVPLPQFIYTGDTTNRIFEGSLMYTGEIVPELDWHSFPFIVTECTFLPEMDSTDVIKLARQDRHNHLGCLEKVAEKYQRTIFILCHWSARYKEGDVYNFFEKKNYSNIVAWASKM